MNLSLEFTCINYFHTVLYDDLILAVCNDIYILILAIITSNNDIKS